MEHIRQIWRSLSTTICNCFNCTEDLGNQVETGERTYLLGDPAPILRRIDDGNHSNEPVAPKKDVQNALSRLVQKTVYNMIDVGAIDSHNLEHQEYNDRIKLYSQRLQQQWSSIQLPTKISSGPLKDIPNSESQLIKLPLHEDIIEIKFAMEKIQTAVLEIRIDHKEAIVVPFRIP